MPASPRGYLLVGLFGFGCGFATAERIYATDSERSRVAFIGKCSLACAALSVAAAVSLSRPARS